MSTVSSVKDRITAYQAAEIMEMDHSQVCRYCQSGRLPAEKFGAAWMIRPIDARRFKRNPPGNPNFRLQK